jgi:hypothetical protein
MAGRRTKSITEHNFVGLYRYLQIFGGKSGSNVIINDLAGLGKLGIGTNTPTQKLSVMGNICATGSVSSCSDAPYKKNIFLLTGVLTKVLSLQAISYDWNRAYFEIGFSFP